MATLFIQIDSSPIPEEISKNYVILDCQQKATILSIIGDSLVGNLKDEQGVYLFKKLKSLITIVSDFEQIEKSSFLIFFSEISSSLISSMASRYPLDNSISIVLPNQFSDWLINHINSDYNVIGNSLIENDNKLSIEMKGAIDDVTSSIHFQIQHYFKNSNNKFDTVVFNNKLIGNSSYLINKLHDVFDGMHILRYDDFIQHVTCQNNFFSDSKNQKEIETACSKKESTFKKDLCVIYSHDKHLILGKTKIEEVRDGFAIDSSLKPIIDGPYYSYSKQYSIVAGTIFEHISFKFFNDTFLELELPSTRSIGYFKTDSIPILEKFFGIELNKYFTNYESHYKSYGWDFSYLTLLNILEESTIKQQGYKISKRPIIQRRNKSHIDVTLEVRINCGTYSLFIYGNFFKCSYYGNFSDSEIMNEVIHWRFSFIHHDINSVKINLLI